MFGYSIASVVNILITLYTWAIFAYVVLSWFPIRGALVDVYRVLSTICEPWIGLFRRIVPTAQVGGGGLDFSPFIALIVLQILGRVIVGALVSAGF